MKRNWIVGAVTVVVCVFALLAATAWHGRPRNGNSSRPPALFHEPYNGVEFRYPATWRDAKGARGIADFKGERDCEVIVGASADQSIPAAHALDTLRQEMIQDNPKAVFGQRPAWAGKLLPDASFAMTKGGAGGVRIVEWENSFQHPDYQIGVSEYMREGDDACRQDLTLIERDFRLFPADTHAQ